MSSPRLWAATRTRYRFVTLASPRSQVRRPPPVSQTWAKLRSTNSLRFFWSRLLRAPLVRRRFAAVAFRHASGLSSQLYPLPLGSGM